MSTLIEAGATDVVAVIEYVLRARTQCTMEDIAGLLRLDPIQRRGAQAELVDNTLFLDPCLPRAEQQGQWALGIARFLIREGAACRDEVVLANALLSPHEHREELRELACVAG